MEPETRNQRPEGMMIAELPLTATAPVEFQLLPLGRINALLNQPFLVDAEGVKKIIAGFQTRHEDMVIDYQHQTEGVVRDPDGNILADYRPPDGKALAAGWIKELADRGPAGLWAKVEWTQPAAAEIAAKQFRYFSPVFLYDQARRIVSILRVGLTNAPRLEGLQPLVASAVPAVAGQKVMEEKRMDKLKQMLGLDPAATDDQVAAAVQALLDKAKGGTGITSAVLGALALPADADESKTVAAINVLKAHEARSGTVEDLQTEIASMKLAVAKKNAEDLVDQGLKDGKLTPANKGWALDYAAKDPAGFATYIAAAPVVVIAGRMIASSPPAGKAATDEAFENAHRMTGVSKADWDKFGPGAKKE